MATRGKQKQRKDAEERERARTVLEDRNDPAMRAWFGDPDENDRRRKKREKDKDWKDKAMDAVYTVIGRPRLD